MVEKNKDPLSRQQIEKDLNKNLTGVTVLPIDDDGCDDFTMVPKNYLLLDRAEQAGAYEPTYGKINWEKMNEHNFTTTPGYRRIAAARKKD